MQWTFSTAIDTGVERGCLGVLLLNEAGCCGYVVYDRDRIGCSQFLPTTHWRDVLPTTQQKTNDTGKGRYRPTMEMELEKGRRATGFVPP